MKTETEHTRWLTKELRRRLPRSVVFKHCDLYTAGVPDLSVTLAGVTTWFEAKRLAAAGDGVVVVRRQDVPAVQWETLWRLGRGYLVVYTAGGHALTHVAGPWRSVERMTLRLMSPAELIAGALALIKSSKTEAGND